MTTDREEEPVHVATLGSMEVSLTTSLDAVAALGRLRSVLRDVGTRVIACSGGIDSLVLSVVAHRGAPATTTIAHTVTPAVPSDGTERVSAYAAREGWNLEIVRSGEFADEAYLANPHDRCYHCKRNLYDAVGQLAQRIDVRAGPAVVLSGANLDDLGEYRPGLAAAAERAVRHPYVEARISKAEVRGIARHLGLAEADLPASPCLASRLYTGTRVTPSRVRAVEVGEALVRTRVGIGVVRCRMDDTTVRIEVTDPDRGLITDELLAEVEQAMAAVEPSIVRVVLDAGAYAPGRSFVRDGEHAAS